MACISTDFLQYSGRRRRHRARQFAFRFVFEDIHRHASSQLVHLQLYTTHVWYHLLSSCWCATETTDIKPKTITVNIDIIEISISRNISKQILALFSHIKMSYSIDQSVGAAVSWSIVNDQFASNRSCHCVIGTQFYILVFAFRQISYYMNNRYLSL